MAGPLRLLVIYNPTAGWRRQRVLHAVLDELRQQGAVVTLRETKQRGDAEKFARAAQAKFYDRIVVAGGDGTINEAINGLVGRKLPLAIVPMGTANVLAAEIGVGLRPSQIAASILHSTPRPVMLGRTVTANGDKRRFVMMAGVGFDANVVENLNLRLKRMTGKFAYVVASLMQILRHRGRIYEVTIDGYSYRAASAIIANGHYYGGRFVAAPDARLEDRSLQVCLFDHAGRIDIIRYALALMLGRLHRLPDVSIIPAQRITITGPAGEPVQLDGDADAHLPIHIDLDDHRLQLVMPAAA
jgi:diacylglycerol kinase (ATP)